MREEREGGGLGWVGLGDDVIEERSGREEQRMEDLNRQTRKTFSVGENHS